MCRGTQDILLSSYYYIILLQEFQVEMTQHDVPLLVKEAKQCVSQKYPFADIIEVMVVL